VTLTDESHVVIGDEAAPVHLTPQGWWLVAALFSTFVLWPIMIGTIVLIVWCVR
jgi:hypothetical protein